MRVVTEPKSNRKSRRTRLPVSSAEGSHEFNPSEDDWRRIEKAYRDLSMADREMIIGIVNKYFSSAPFERNAPFFDDAMAWLKSAEESATTFWKLWVDEGNFRNDEAILYARNYVERQIEFPVFNAIDAAQLGLSLSKWNELGKIMTSVVSAFAIARRDLPKKAQPGFVEGECWDAMICSLSDFAEGKGWPTGASKGVDKTASLKPSSFVAFIRELQNTFPKEMRRHNHSDISIAEAIAVARRGRHSDQTSPPPSKKHRATEG